ncbi:MAG: hypothetical protein ACK40G_17225 [Cytophagaceae bacterium]
MHRKRLMKIFFMASKNQPRTLEDFLKSYAGAGELAKAIDRTMLSLVLLLKYEPEHLEAVVHCYETLYHLKKLILQQD